MGSQGIHRFRWALVRTPPARGAVRKSCVLCHCNSTPGPTQLTPTTRNMYGRKGCTLPTALNSVCTTCRSCLPKHVPPRRRESNNQACAAFVATRGPLPPESTWVHTCTKIFITLCGYPVHFVVPVLKTGQIAGGILLHQNEPLTRETNLCPPCISAGSGGDEAGAATP